LKKKNEEEENAIQEPNSCSLVAPLAIVGVLLELKRTHNCVGTLK
jgi:hypothetical protein